MTKTDNKCVCVRDYISFCHDDGGDADDAVKDDNEDDDDDTSNACCGCACEAVSHDHYKMAETTSSIDVKREMFIRLQHVRSQ